MDERGHFLKFKGLHKASMALANADKTHFTSSNGRSSAKGMQDTLRHLPDSFPAKHHWRDQLRSWWYRFEREWEPVTVNKHIDSVTMPKWIAIGIFTATLAFGVQSWWRSSDQRDMLIELKTELRMAKQYEAERARELKEQAELNKVHIDNITGELKTIKGMLSASQLNAIEQIKRGDN